MEQVIELKPADITPFWRHINGMLNDALEKTGFNTRYPIEALYADLVSGNYGCVIVTDGENIKAAAVIEINKYPLGDSLLVFLLAGDDMGSWYEALQDYLVKFAEKRNIKWIDACVRHGLSKKYLSKIGYQQLNVNCTYEVA